MAKKKPLSTKRFGARYGNTIKEKYAKIESEQRRLHKCPYCKQPKAKRLASGIWHCKKCNSKFTGKAYTLSKKAILAVEGE
ncbi:50S ribosomal protein L37ae [Candidatus Woesearchaeota archaeon]|nr:50S ribosomal protein L37ae [Candidatus Woesearchaeota archaeon]